MSDTEEHIESLRTAFSTGYRTAVSQVATLMDSGLHGVSLLEALQDDEDKVINCLTSVIRAGLSQEKPRRKRGRPPKPIPVEDPMEDPMEDPEDFLDGEEEEEL